MPTATRTTPSTARKTNSMATFLDLDSDEFVYDDRAHDHADQARHRQHQPRTRREQRAHVGRRNQHQQSADGHGQARHDPARHAALRRHGPNFTLQLDPLADRAGNRVENARQVATDLELDQDGDDQQFEVITGDTSAQVNQGFLRTDTQPDLAYDALELFRDGRFRFTGDHFHRLHQAEARAQR